jgi:hypothetical protein
VSLYLRPGSGAAPLHPSFHYGINALAQHKGMPADQDPGLAPGARDVVNIRMKRTGLTYTVTLRDNFGRTQQVTRSSDRWACRTT